MAGARAVVAAALQAVQAAAMPGVSTLELDAIAESVIRDPGSALFSATTTTRRRSAHR